MIINIWDGIIQPSKRKVEEVKIHLSIVLPFLLMMWKTKNVNVKWLTRNISMSGLLSSMLIITGYKITCSWKLSIRLEKNLDETKNPRDLNNWLVHWHHDLHNWLVHWHHDLLRNNGIKMMMLYDSSWKENLSKLLCKSSALENEFSKLCRKILKLYLVVLCFLTEWCYCILQHPGKKNSRTENAIDFINYEISKF